MRRGVISAVGTAVTVLLVSCSGTSTTATSSSSDHTTASMATESSTPSATAKTVEHKTGEAAPSKRLSEVTPEVTRSPSACRSALRSPAAAAFSRLASQSRLTRSRGHRWSPRPTSCWVPCRIPATRQGGARRAIPSGGTPPPTEARVEVFQNVTDGAQQGWLARRGCLHVSTDTQCEGGSLHHVLLRPHRQADDRGSEP